MTCTINGCDKPVQSSGLCSMHDKRLRRRGSPLVVLPNANASKTHCKHGHAYTPDNTYTTSDGRRMCLACKRERQNAARRRQRDADRAWYAANGTTPYRHAAD